MVFSSANGSSTWLVFNGLDTFATIELCGQHVAATNNQFRQYYFDVSNITASCDSPVLSVSFGSAPIIANATAALPGQNCTSNISLLSPQCHIDHLLCI
jgi:beta-mannosidase